VSKLRVLLADEHAILRSGLHLLLGAQPDLEVVGEAADVKETLRRACELRPDVLILDLTMPGGSGIRLIEQLRQRCPSVRVLILTMHDDLALVRAALAAGARGYVVKTAADAELVTAIRAVCRGRTFVDLDLSAEQMPVLLGEADDDEGKARRPADRLSEREREVLLLLAHGYTNQEIADRLDVSVKTVETYRARIGDKLNLRTRPELIRFAIETGLLAPGKFPPSPIAHGSGAPRVAGRAS
jgi:DNA-binding NarL/FixJ family response regulator